MFVGACEKQLTTPIRRQQTESVIRIAGNTAAVTFVHRRKSCKRLRLPNSQQFTQGYLAPICVRSAKTVNARDGFFPRFNHSNKRATLSDYKGPHREAARRPGDAKRKNPPRRLTRHGPFPPRSLAHWRLKIPWGWLLSKSGEHTIHEGASPALRRRNSQVFRPCELDLAGHDHRRFSESHSKRELREALLP